MEEWKFWKETNRGRYGHRIYEVSNQGNVKINGEIIDLPNKGYIKIASEYLHRIVATLFVPNTDPENYNVVDHINGDVNDNRAINLRWCTQQMNNSYPLIRQRISDANKISQNRPEVKRKKSESNKGRVAWNKGIKMKQIINFDLY